MSRANVFIGSSSEGKEIARAIQLELADVADAEVWDEGVFGLSLGTLESLVQALDTFDFAVLVLTPDDLLVRQGEERNAARDNVLLELGLFMGRLGRSRTFAVCQKDSNLKLPSDLAGVSLASFSAPGGSGRLVATLGPACFKIRNAIRAYQKEAAVDQIQAHLHAQETQLAEQRQQIEEQQDVINKLVIFSMAAYIFDHLKALYHRQRKGGEYLYRKNDAFERDLRFLRDHGYVEMLNISGLNDKQNLVDMVKLTPVGN